VLLGTVALAAWSLVFRRDLFKVDRRGLLLVGLGGGALVALFEVAYQFAIAGAGVASAAVLLYTAPFIVAILAVPLLKEKLTSGRLALAAVVGVGAVFAVRGGSRGANLAGVELPRLALGIAGGLLAALSYAGTTLLARFAVPRYGVAKVLLLEITGGTVLLGLILPLAGRSPAPPATMGGWLYVVALVIGTVLLANVFFFSGAKRIEAAPTAVAATIEPVVATLLALVLFSQRLTAVGWLGLLMVVGGVAAGYLEEARGSSPAATAAD
jgi:DME family drug/metabolite transporter